MTSLTGEADMNIESVIRDYMASISRLDAEAWVNLFAEDGVLQGPAHQPPIQGRESLRGFLQQMGGLFASVEMQPEAIYAGEHEAAACFRIDGVGRNGTTISERGVIVVETADSGRITRVSGYWNPQPMLAALMAG
jgi:ketosteroid isomerase-like protein